MNKKHRKPQPRYWDAMNDLRDEIHAYNGSLAPTADTEAVDMLHEGVGKAKAIKAIDQLIANTYLETHPSAKHLPMLRSLVQGHGAYRAMRMRLGASDNIL